MGIEPLSKRKPAPFLIVPSFQHSITLFLQLDRYKLCRQGPDSFPLLYFLYPFKSRGSSANCPAIYQAPSLFYRLNLSFNWQTNAPAQHNSHLQLVNLSAPGNGDRWPEIGQRLEMVLKHPVQKLFANAVGSKERDPITGPALEFIKNRPAETHWQHKALETPPAAPENPPMLITARFKGSKPSPFKTGLSMLTLHHFSREQVLTKTFQPITDSNMYSPNGEPQEPGYEKSNVSHENKLLVHHKTSVPGSNGIKQKMPDPSSLGIFSSITPLLQHPGDRKALHLHHFNPRQKAAGSVDGTGKSPGPYQDDSPLQLNKALPGAPAFMQTGKQTDNMNLDMDRLTDRVYSMLAKKIRTEKERRGW